MPAGRPTAYKPEYAEQAKKLCALGATDAEMANFFSVAISTINLWKIKHPEFSESLNLGKEVADKRVVEALYQRAMGFSHEDTDIRVVDGAIMETPMIKHYPPDTTAAIFWLKNRRPDEWRDKVDLAHGGTDGGAIRSITDIRITGVRPDGNSGS
ncbi:terminase [Pseudomonas veronii]|uniref:terminase n=1 Tax=Pseudomonas veronii TaxID=76761 RepID=UPI0014766E63|nr:terminase [Pseudomonas veronii]NMX39371.1 terminase [Pseudomonas veronii]